MKKHIYLSIFLLLFLLVYGCRAPVIIESVPVEQDASENRFLYAERLYNAKHYSEALRNYSRYLLEKPDGPNAPNALMRKGEIYSTQRNYPAARDALEEMLKRFPESHLVSEASILLLSADYGEGKYRKIIERGKSVLKQVRTDEEKFRVFIILGDSEMASGFPEGAVGYYCDAMRIKDGGRQLLQKMNEAVNQLSSSAIEKLLQDKKNAPVKDLLLYRLGRNRIDEEDFKAASEVFRKFLELYPDHRYSEMIRGNLERLEKMPTYTMNTVGCLLPLSGRYKAYGEKALRGIELAGSQSSYKEGALSINIVIEDTGSNPAKTLSAIKKLEEQNVSAIIGPIAMAVSAARYAQKRGIPIITLTPFEDITEIGDYVFRNFITKKMEVNALVSYAVGQLGIHKFAVLHPEEPYGTTNMNLFWDEVLAYGGKVVGVESYPPDLTDFSEPIKKLVRFQGKIKGSLQKNTKETEIDFEAIFIPDYPEKAGLIIPQLAFYDVENVLLLGTKLWYSDRMIRLAGNYMKHVVIPVGFFPDSESPETRNFIEKFQVSFGEKPGFVEGVAYDSANILFSLIRKKDIRHRSSLRNGLLNLKNYPGVTGLTGFDEIGEAVKQLVLLSVEKGKFTEITEKQAFPVEENE